MKAFLTILFALIFGLGGLLMSSCGLIFLVAGGGSGVAVIALPAFIIGALLIWAAYALVKSRKKADEPPAAPSPPSVRE